MEKGREYKMNCVKCGEEINDDSKFCKYCGTSVDLKEKKNLLQNYYSLFAIVLLVAVFFYLVWRAVHLSITHDEAFTYIHYATRSYAGIFREYSIANNHFLNTVLVKLFTDRFGLSEFIVRIPSLLGASLYLVFSYKLSRLLFRNIFFLLSIILLVTNHFLLEFLSLARGYSIALGFMMMALYYFFIELQEKKTKFSNLALIVTALSLSVLSMLTFVYVYSALLIILTLIEIFRQRDFFKNKPLIIFRNIIKKIIIPVGISAFSLFILLSKPVDKMQKTGQFYGGGETSFWDNTLKSLIEVSIYADGNFKSVLVVIIAFLIALFISLFCFIYLKKVCMDQKFWLSTWDKNILAIFSILLFFWLFIESHHLFGGMRYVISRKAIFFIPVFTIFFILFFSYLSSTRYGAITSTLLVVISGFFIFNLVLSFNLTHTDTFRYDAHTKDIMHSIMEMEEGNTLLPGSKAIGIDWSFEPSVNFYRIKYDLFWIKQADRSGPDNVFDYYILKNESKEIIDKYDARLIKHYQDNGVYFAAR